MLICRFLKFTLLLFFFTSGFTAHSQNEWEIKLSKNSKSELMGVWEQGDYKIYVELSQMKSFLDHTYQEYTNNILRCTEKDSNLVKYYRPTAQRYLNAAKLIEKANKDFDLRTLIIYHGTEDINQNMGNSAVIRSYIKQLVEGGSAIVTYKGEQIFTLQCKSEYKEQGGILYHGYEIKTFFDDVKNCIFSEFTLLGW
jgi:hypothetical protein